jgi:hypothetical protein
VNPMSPDPTPPAANRRPLLLAGAGVAGVLLGLVLLITVAGPESAAPPPPPATTTTVTGPEEPEPPAGLDPELAFAAGRDPFEQIVTVPDIEPPADRVPADVAPPPPAAPPPAPAAAPAPPPAPAPGPAGTDGVAQDPPPPPPPPQPPVHDPSTPGIWYFPSSSPPPGEHSPYAPPPQEPPPEAFDDPVLMEKWMSEHLRLWAVLTDDAGARRAFITVVDRSYLPAVGQTFAEHFRLERIDPDCVEVSAPNLRPGICVPRAGQAGDAPPA